MQGLTTDLLSRACRIFLALAYPEGEPAIPLTRAAYLRLQPCVELSGILIPPICQTIEAAGQPRGYALRLGSSHYPHLKLQVVNCDPGLWVFAVDTHDGFKLDSCHPDEECRARIQAANQRLKAEIERAWEVDGILTFNALLRRGLDISASAATAGIGA